MILAYAAVLDRKYEKLLAYLQDDMTRKHPGIEIAVQLFIPKNASMEQYMLRFGRTGDFTGLFRQNALENGNLGLEMLVLEYLSSGTIIDRAGLAVFDGAADQPTHALIAQQDIAERLALFQTFLRDIPHGKDVIPEELAAKFHFTPRQIVQACRQAEGWLSDRVQELDSVHMHEVCYGQIVHKLGALAHRVPAAYTWEDVVLPDAHKRLMQQACSHIQYRCRVYHVWGFDKKITYGRGLTILVAGAPGTGKTMCAQVIARQLSMEMYQINISQIASKYIDETEKNLQAVFAEARDSNCILFFDECDALFIQDQAVCSCDARSNDGFSVLTLLYCKGDKELAHCDIPAKAEYAGEVLGFLKKQFEENGIHKRHYAREAVIADEVFTLCCRKAAQGSRIMVECGIAPDAQMVNIRVTAVLGGADPLQGNKWNWNRMRCSLCGNTRIM